MVTCITLRTRVRILRLATVRSRASCRVPRQAADRACSMMTPRMSEAIMLGTRSIAIALLLAAAVACDDDSTGTGSTATLRVANATNTAVDVASATVIATGNANIGFGASSGCVT